MLNKFFGGGEDVLLHAIIISVHFQTYLIISTLDQKIYSLLK